MSELVRLLVAIAGILEMPPRKSGGANFELRASTGSCSEPLTNDGFRHPAPALP